MPFKKSVIPFSGLVAGLLLSIALAAVQLNNAFFNSGFQQSVIDRLDVYERVLASADPASRGSMNTPFEAAVKNSITPDLFNKNIESLVDGLIDFISGRTNKLPDLYIAGTDKLSIAASAGVTPAAVEKINLQLLMMFSGEQSFNDILSVASLVQFLLSYLPLFSLLLFSAFAITEAKRSLSYILVWMNTVILSFFIFSWLAAWVIGSTPWFLPLPALPSAAAGGVLTDYIRYCTGFVSGGILLSCLTVLAGYKISLYFHERFYHMPEITQLTVGSTINQTDISHIKVSPSIHHKRVISVLLLSTAIYSLPALILIENAYGIYNRRNLDNAVSYIMGSISYNRYTDARNDDVCLLKLRILNGSDKTPVQDLKAEVYPIDSGENVSAKKLDEKETVVRKTDNGGVASFLLSEGEFRLELDPFVSSDTVYPGIVTPLTYDFSLAAPGMTDLTVTLGSDPAAAAITDSAVTTAANSDLRIVDASMQYVP